MNGKNVQRDMGIDMMEHKIHIPVIKVDVDYLLSSVEKIGLLQLEILDIYDKCINNENFKNHTFQNIFKTILQTDIPKIFLEDALQYLNKEKILMNSSKNLISLPLKDFHIENEIVATILKNKELYSDPQSQNISLYYNPFNQEFITNDSSKFYKEGDVIDGNEFINTNINDNAIIDCIEERKPKETSFFRDGVEIKIILKDSKRREVLYIEQSVDYKFIHNEKNIFKIVFGKKYKFMEHYKDKFIERLINENKIMLEFKNEKYNIVNNTIDRKEKFGLVLTDIENIEDKVDSDIYVIFGKINKNPKEMDSNGSIKFLVDWDYKIIKNSYVNGFYIYSLKEILLSTREYPIVCSGNDSDEFYSKIQSVIVSYIIDKTFEKYNYEVFFENIKLLNKLQRLDNSNNVITNELVKKLKTIDINDFAIKRFILIVKYSDTLFDKKSKEMLYEEFIDLNSEFSFADFERILNEEKLVKDIEIVKDIFESKRQNDISQEALTDKAKYNHNSSSKHIGKSKDKTKEKEALSVSEIPKLAHRVISLISDINDTQKKINKEEVFITTHKSSKETGRLGIECHNENLFQLFSTSLWLILKDGSQHGENKYKNIPKEFRMNHNFFKLLDNTRHHHGGHNLNPKRFKMTKEDIYKELKGDILAPKNKEWATMQQNLLTKAENYLNELEDYKRDEFRKKGENR